MFRMYECVYLLVIGCCCAVQVRSAGFDAAEVTRVLERVHTCHNNPGLGVSVVKDGKVIYTGGFGVKNIDTQEPVDDDTVFGIASVSKSFAATLLVKLLYETTNLTVDSKVQELLGEKFKLMDEFRTKEATFADLMGHRLAIPSNNRMRFDSNLTRESLMERLSLLPAPDQFRVKYTYSNLVYGLVTYLAEVLGQGESWESLVSKHLLQPLGMDQTVFATTADLPNAAALATGYREVGDNLYPVHTEFSRKWALLAGSGAVMSTAPNMAKWMNFHLSEGKADGGRTVISAYHLEEVHKARMLIEPLTRSLELREPQFPASATQNIYAHGFRRGSYRGYDRLVHSGSTLGYKALMTLIPALKIGVFTAVTGVDSDYNYRSALHYFLLDSAMGLHEPWLNASTMCSFPEPWRRKSSSSTPTLDASLRPTLNLTHFEGTYYNQAYGYAHVSFNTTLSSLVLTYGWGSWQLHYRPRSGDSTTHRFYGKCIDITAINLNPMYFLQDDHQGEDTIVGMKATAFESKLPPVFSKLGLSNEHSSATKTSNFATFLLLLVLVATNLAIVL